MMAMRLMGVHSLIGREDWMGIYLTEGSADDLLRRTMSPAFRGLVFVGKY
jgi:hypothetical protein